MKTVKQIVADALKEMGADGLWCEDCDCSCGYDNEILNCSDCVPARLVNGVMKPIKKEDGKCK